MIYIPFISDLMKNARERNVEAGIILFALCSLIIYIPTGFFIVRLILLADLQLLIGAIIGIRFTLKNQEQEVETLKTGVITGIFGGTLSAVLIAFYEWIWLSIKQGEIVILALVWFILLFLISGIVIGLIMGALMSTFYMYKEVKRPDEDKHIDEDFFKDLMED